MANPTAEGDGFLDFKGSHELLEAVPLRAIADNCKAGQIASQKRSGRAQREVTSFAGDQPTDKDQFKLGARLQTTGVVGTEGTPDTRFRDKK